MRSVYIVVIHSGSDGHYQQRIRVVASTVRVATALAERWIDEKFAAGLASIYSTTCEGDIHAEEPQP